ncbi:CPBP family intramembrane glutamic endopeptidase [Leptospira sp. GIMC2001]|uniref:CPBP family intramembrane glutamic endopeptidase n=1 Tax=Leptospira sp. GIMC2001 TaxID=1513297 RepID=UPI002349401C|nr:type II CAAX endopeptidase family protein [Leptospira sp. GIMC2001]WCL49899.1 type II CAAX endopeptidase family protein [Leptospira sp. GIMC2001]
MYPTILKVILITFVLLCIQFAFGILIAIFKDTEYFNSFRDYIISGSNVIAIFAVSLYAFRKSKLNLMDMMSFRKDTTILIFPALAITYALHIVGAFLSVMVFQNSTVSQGFVESSAEYLPINQIPLYFLLVVVAPITEELYFRGFAFLGLMRNYSFFVSMLVSTLLFCVIHLNPSQMVGAALIGVFSCYLLYLTKNIVFSILIHAMYNGLFLVLPPLISKFNLHSEIWHYKTSIYTFDLIDFSGIILLLIGIPLFLFLKSKIRIEQNMDQFIQPIENPDELIA